MLLVDETQAHLKGLVSVHEVENVRDLSGFERQGPVGRHDQVFVFKVTLAEQGSDLAVTGDLSQMEDMNRL